MAKAAKANLPDVENGIQEGQGGYDEENTQTVITIPHQSAVSGQFTEHKDRTINIDKVIGSLSAGAKVDYIGQDGWYKVRYGDEVAMFRQTYLILGQIPMRAARWP